MTTPSVFEVRVFDHDKALEAMQAMVAAYDASRNGSVDVDRVGAALGVAVEAFPGLQAFVEQASDDVSLNTAPIAHDVDVEFLHPARDLALIGAYAEVYSGFDWSDVDPLLPQCRQAMNTVLASAPGLR